MRTLYWLVVCYLVVCSALFANPLIQQQVQYPYVVTPTVQQLIAVPVQPYYYSYSNNVSSGNHVVNSKPGESQYLTKSEFLEAMRMLLATQGGDTQYLREQNPQEIKLKEMVKAKCISCHQGANAKGNVTFLDESGKWSKGINWDRILTVTISGKMPKNGAKLNAEEVQSIIDKAKDWKPELPTAPITNPTPPVAVPPVPTPPVDGSY